MTGTTEQSDAASSGAPAPPSPPQPEWTWLFVGDFLFYLRLLARQFSRFTKREGSARRAMVIVPEVSMAWDHAASGHCELVLIDLAETTPEHLELLRQIKANHPRVRSVIVSANMTREMESELMAAGADLCFSKPRSEEEAESVFMLVDALARDKEAAPAGNLAGLPPARFIQFLCARSESGTIALDTEWGEATLVLQGGLIIDASLGDLRGDAAAASILSLNCTQRCLFKNMESSNYHTVRLTNHELWQKSGKPKDPVEAPVSRVPHRPPPAKSLSETMASLENIEKVFLNVQVEAASGHTLETGGQIARVSQIMADPEALNHGAGPRPGEHEELSVNKFGAVLSSEKCPDAVKRSETVTFLRGKGAEVRRCLGAGQLRGLRGEGLDGQWRIAFKPEVSEFRFTPSGQPTKPEDPASAKKPDPMVAMERLASLRGKGPVQMCGYFEPDTDRGWNVSWNSQIKEEKREGGVMHCLWTAYPKIIQSGLPFRQVVWEFDGCIAFVHRLSCQAILMAACYATPRPEFENSLASLAAEMESSHA